MTGFHYHVIRKNEEKIFFILLDTEFASTDRSSSAADSDRDHEKSSAPAHATSTFPTGKARELVLPRFSLEDIRSQLSMRRLELEKWKLEEKTYTKYIKFIHRSIEEEQDLIARMQAELTLQKREGTEILWSRVWYPESKAVQEKEYFANSPGVFLISPPEKTDNPPILLKNNYFSAPDEAIIVSAGLRMAESYNDAALQVAMTQRLATVLALARKHGARLGRRSGARLHVDRRARSIWSRYVPSDHLDHY